MNEQAKWFWKMDYCKKQGLPPARSWVWDKAEQECEKFIKSKTGEK